MERTRTLAISRSFAGVRGDSQDRVRGDSPCTPCTDLAVHGREHTDCGGNYAASAPAWLRVKPPNPYVRSSRATMRANQMPDYRAYQLDQLPITVTVHLIELR